jgi:sigma-B regulation protein RsbU (phosphoserine phosphatase)
MNRPASHVSGDFYNWFELSDGRAVLIVGDVTGHGLPAAFLMATTQLLVRMTMERLGDAGAAMRQVNRQLCHHVFSGQFVTMIIVVIDTTKGSLEIATAGHPPPLIGNGENFTALSVEPQLVLAVDDDVAYITQRFELKDGASLLLYTDGITDVQSPSGERLQIEGLANSLYGRFTSAKTLLDAATDAVETFRVGREPADDLTMVAVQFQPAPAAAEHLDSDLTPAKVS